MIKIKIKCQNNNAAVKNKQVKLGSKEVLRD